MNQEWVSLANEYAQSALDEPGRKHVFTPLGQFCRLISESRYASQFIGVKDAHNGMSSDLSVYLLRRDEKSPVKGIRVMSCTGNELEFSICNIGSYSSVEPFLCCSHLDTHLIIPTFSKFLRIANWPGAKKLSILERFLCGLFGHKMISD
jgi:hypothetical protein